MIRRLIEELRAAYSDADVERALATLVVRRDQDALVVSRAGGGARLFPVEATLASLGADASERMRTVARVEPGVYVETPSRGARVRLLEALAELARRVEVHAPIATGSTHRGRLVIDNARRALRSLGVSTAEPGDRFGRHLQEMHDARAQAIGDFRATERGFVHAFFDDEPLITEAARAGLAFVIRRGPWIVFERSALARQEKAAPFAREVARVLRVIHEAERRRTHEPPQGAVAAMRARGTRARARGPIGRARLRRAIGWVDAAFPAGPNCFRRTLVEVALDAGAASETLVFGLDVGKTGHVAFKDAEDRTFDVAFEIPP